MKALITGATSGIGEAFATKLAQMGYDLIITGRRKDVLQTLSEKLRDTYHINVECIIAELSNEEELEHLATRIRQINDLYILINNAGFGTRSSFLDEDYNWQANMVKVNVLAPMKLIYAALPSMIRKNRGFLINVSSISGKMPLPTGAVYSATKAFLQMFSESLYLENIHSNIKIQTLCPGFTKTDFHKRVGLKYASNKNKGVIRWMTPEEVVSISLKNLEKGNVICVPGFFNKVLWFLSSIIPRRIYYKMVTEIARREAKHEADYKTVPSGS